MSKKPGATATASCGRSFANALKVAITGAMVVASLVFAVPAQAATWVVGDVFLGVAGGNYQVRSATGALKETVNGGSGFTTGCAFDKSGNLYGTFFSNNTVVKFNEAHPHASSTFGSGYATPESIVFDAAGNVFVGNVSNGIRMFDSTGVFIKTVINTRVDFFDIAADQDTILYTQEGSDIRRVSISTGASLSNFTTGTATQAYAIRILPDGGALLADQNNVKRYNSAGVVVQTYDVAGEDSWFALNLDTNGTSFYSGNFTTGNYYRFNIASGAVELGPIATVPGNLFGVCVKGEFTVSNPPTINPCVPEPTPVTGDIVGTPGNDRIVGTNGPDRIFGLGGNDEIAGLGGDDVIFGGPGEDRLSGGDGNDTLCGGASRDYLDGGTGNDRLFGGDGNDDLAGGAGDDALAGEAGDDRLSGGTGTNTNDGGTGSDTCVDPSPGVNCSP